MFVLWMIFCFFFFFKQKTAYEMRISDWSSDVCSSDLRSPKSDAKATLDKITGAPAERNRSASSLQLASTEELVRGSVCSASTALWRSTRMRAVLGGDKVIMMRSEEHTSELQSLMRISYAVFCLKKKNTK